MFNNHKLRLSSVAPSPKRDFPALSQHTSSSALRDTGSIIIQAGLMPRTVVTSVMLEDHQDEKLQVLSSGP
jgi:hypothetical protein